MDGATTQLTLTAEELSEVRASLAARAVETDLYLRQSTPQPHDACCKAEAARQEWRAQVTAGLQQRMDAVRSAQAKVAAAVGVPADQEAQK